MEKAKEVGQANKTLYSEDNLWVEIMSTNPGEVKIGLTEAFQKAFGEIEFVRILPRGRYVGKGNPFGSLESGRKIVLLRAPVSGSIQSVNDELRAQPELINKSPRDQGWLAVIKPIKIEDDLKTLLSKPAEV